GLRAGPGEKLYGYQRPGRHLVVIDAHGKESAFSGIKVATETTVAVTRTGECYCIASGLLLFRRLVRIDKDGTIHDAWQEGRSSREQWDKALVPQCLALWPDQGTLVISGLAEPWLWAVRVEANGELGHAERYYALRAPPGLPSVVLDMTVDAATRLY